MDNSDLKEDNRLEDTKDGANVSWTKKPFVRQVGVASCVWSSYFQIGLYYGACPVLVARLRREPLADGTLVDDEKASWISSAGSFSGIICVVLLGLMGEYLGRRLSYIFISISSCAGFGLLYSATSYNMLVLAQILQGPLFGGASIVSLILAAECLSPKHRVVCMTINGANSFWAIWLANAVGTFFHWRIIGVIGMGSAIYGLLVMSVCPDSPYWLASKRKFEKCREAHRWFRGAGVTASKDVEGLIKSEMERSRKIKGNTYYEQMLFYIKKMSAREFYQPMCLCVLLSMLFQLSGKIAISVYVIDIIQKITVNESTAYTGMMILDGATILGMYMASIILRYVKRRLAFFATEFVTVFSLLFIAFYLYLIKLGFVNENVYVSISLLVVFSFNVAYGPTMLAYTLICELLPLQLRTFATVVQCLAANFVGSVILKLTPWLFSSLGTHGAFSFFAIGSLVCIVILLKYLPETSDKTLEEIENSFKKKGKSKSNDIQELKPLADPVSLETGGQL